MALNVEKLTAELDNISAESFADEASRVRARNAASALLSRLESPWDTAMKHVWCNPAYTAALKVAHDLQLFQRWNDVGGGIKTCRELADLTGADITLLARLLRHIAAMHGLIEDADETYGLTPFTTLLGTPGPMALMPFMHSITGPGFHNLPAFLTDTRHRNPSDLDHSNWQQLHQSPENFFQWMTKDTQTPEMFQSVMSLYSQSKPFLTDLYDVDSLFKNADGGRTILVDVGGGSGHDLEKLRQRYPDCRKGALVLQDLPNVLEKAIVHEPAMSMEYDMLTEQPVKGALAYYFHTVLHDWPDAEAVKILQNTAKAMDKTHSRILVQETVLTSARPHVRATTSDLTMMMIASGRERTEADWRELARKAGLEVRKIWCGEVDVDGAESVIEMVLP